MKRNLLIKLSLIITIIVTFIFLYLSPDTFSSENMENNSAREGSYNRAFDTGEKLVFSLTWMGIPAGTATLEVKEKRIMGDREVYYVLSTARSNSFISMFYPVEDQVETFIDAEGVYSHGIKVRQREGNYKSDKEIIFDHKNRKAIMTKNGGEPEVFDIPSKIQDSLSCLYYFRTMNPTVGESVFIDTHESKKNWQLEVKVLKKEKLVTPLGVFNTIKVKALVRFEGVFVDKGDAYIWFTDDDKKIPIQVRSKVKIGSVYATLIEKDGVEVASK